MNDTQQVRFTLERELHRNGLATVYSGRDSSTQGQVYVAMLNGGATANKALLASLRTEIPLLQYADPTLLSVLEYELEVPPYYVMAEPLVGSSLRQLIESEGKGLPPAVALACLKQAARCVEALHGRRALHGALDIDKYVIRNGEFVLLTHTISDLFGASTFLGAQPDSRYNQPDLLEYVAPEQLGRSNPATTVASDIYALGILLYHLLSGATPGVAIGGPYPSAWIGGQTPPLNESVADAILRSRLQKFIHIATSTDPMRRWPDISTFIEALEQITPNDSTGPTRSTGRRGISLVLPGVHRQSTALLRTHVIVPDGQETSAQPLNARLVVPSSGNSYPVNAPRASVGFIRSSGFIPDIDLSGEKDDMACYVSQHHFDLVYDQGHWYAHPHTGARNPTFVDGQQLVSGTGYLLRDGAQLDIPAFRVYFQLIGG